MAGPEAVRHAGLPCLLVGMFALAGCGSSTTTGAVATSAGTSVPSGSASYVGQATNAEVFIQWTRAGNALSGSLQEAIRKEAGSSAVESSSSAFTGTISGNGLTLTLNQGLGSTKALVGQLHGEGFTMTFPGKEHGLASITFVPGQVSDYNHAVREMEGHAEQGGESTSTSTGTFATHVEPCGTIQGPGTVLRVTTDDNVGCAEALGVFRDLFAGRGEHHEGRDAAESYTRIDGWSCGTGAGGFGCKRLGAYISATSE